MKKAAGNDCWRLFRGMREARRMREMRKNAEDMQPRIRDGMQLATESCCNDGRIAPDAAAP
ncbi:MAG: hypothetical protein K2N93_04110 [Alistipes sp.]|nr:hypothetical protein [Alistipes sp.]